MRKVKTSAFFPVLFACVFFVFVGCSSTNVNTVSAPLCVEYEAELEPDLKIGGDISGTSEVDILFWHFAIGMDSKFADGVAYGMPAMSGLMDYLPSKVPALKAAAAYNAITEGNADVIIGPRYTVEITNDFGIYYHIRVTVAGKAGNVTNISQIKDDD